MDYGIDTVPLSKPNRPGVSWGYLRGFMGVWNIIIPGSQTFLFLTKKSSVLKWNLLVPLDNGQKKIWFHFQVSLCFVRKSLFDNIFWHYQKYFTIYHLSFTKVVLVIVTFSENFGQVWIILNSIRKKKSFRYVSRHGSQWISAPFISFANFTFDHPDAIQFFTSKELYDAIIISATAHI